MKKGTFSRICCGGFLGKGLMVFLGSAVGSFFFLFVCVLAVGSPIQDSLFSAHGIISGEKIGMLSPEKSMIIDELRSSGAILTPSDLLSEIASFYEAVITILTTLIAVLSLVAYMYVRAVSEETASNIVKERVKERFDSDEHKTLISNAVKSATSSHISGMESLQADVTEELDKVREYFKSGEMVSNKDLFARITTIETRLALLDQDEDGGSDELLIDLPSGQS